jgi:hypothetical protein
MFAPDYSNRVREIAVHKFFRRDSDNAVNEKSDPFRDRYKEAREGGKSLGKAMQGIVPNGTPKEKSRILEESCKHRKYLRPLLLPSLRAFSRPKPLLCGVAADEFSSV